MAKKKVKVFDFYNPQTGESFSERAENEEEEREIELKFLEEYEPYGWEMYEGEPNPNSK